MMDVTEIQKYLPHRYPFLMLDRVLELVENKSIVALKNVTYNEQIFTGHFPATPVFPGVLIVEAMAQAAGLLAFKSRDRTLNDGYIYYLAATDSTKFKRSVVPGDQLIIEVEVTRLRSHWMKATGRALVEDQLVCQSLLTCAEQKVT
jgi:3-hydroxyacyl-[acyl-carrier-protein] dehydratase